MKLRAVMLATTATLAMIGSGAAAPNVVLNPGFESGGFAPWVSGGSGFNSISGISPHSGAFSFRAGCIGAGCVVVGPTGVSGPGSIIQTINLQPGIYQESFFYRSVGGTNQVAASLGNNTLLNLSNVAAGPYQGFTFLSAVSGGATNVAFGIRNDPSFDFIDDVSLVMVDDGFGNNIGAAAQTVAVQASRDFLDRLQDRFGLAGSPIQMASVRETVLASADGMTYVSAGGRYRAFLNVFGSNADWDDSSTEAERRGVSAGIEVTAGDEIDVGLAVAFSRSEFETQTIFTANSAETLEYQGAIYAHWSPRDVPLYLNAIVGYGRSDNDFLRQSLVGLGDVGANGIEASQVFGSAEIGWDWAVSHGFQLTPYARIDAARVKQDGYSETAFPGALLVPAVVDARDFDAARSILGLRAAFDLEIGSRGGRLVAKAGWAHEFELDRFVTFTETTGPVSFTGVSTAATPAEDSLVVGGTFEAPICDNGAIFVGYNGNFADEQNIHAGEIGVHLTW